MILRILLPLFLSISLFAIENAWSPKTELKFEAGLFLPDISGDISNTHSSTDFNSDLDFSKASASFFSLELRLDYDYVPNIYISYFNLKDNTDSTLSEEKTIADDTFSSNVSSTIGYDSLNAIVYQDFTLKGKTFSLFGTKYYPGDVEFDIGLNVKNLSYEYSIQDKIDLTKAPSWIKINAFIPLPYFGFKYYRYDFIVFGDISALSFNKAKSTTAQFGIDYNIVSGLYLSAGYLYESFEIVEDSDTIVFDTSGFKASFKYKF